MQYRWIINTCAFVAATVISGSSSESLRAAGESWMISDVEASPTAGLPLSVNTLLDEEPSRKPENPEQAMHYRSNAMPRTDRWWFAADYLLLWTDGNSMPPLVSTNSDVPDRAEAGVLGADTTQVLLGGKLDEGGRSGTALSGGYWLDECHYWGLQATWWYAGDPSDELDDVWSSQGDPVLARPFFNAGSGMEDAQLVAYEGVVHGDVGVITSSDLRSAEALLSMNWRNRSRTRVDVLGGYRYFRFREGLLIQEDLTAEGGGVIPDGTTIDLFDRFDTANSFHGATVGLLTNWQRGCFELDVAGKLGIGNVRRRLRIDGRTVVTTPEGGEDTVETGLLALSSNAGRYEDDTFGLLPELNLEGRVLLTEHLSVNLGYNLLFLTDVYRTGDQIDRTIDPGLIGTDLPINDQGADGLAHPAVPRESSTLCVQGLNIGCTLSY
ncbi:MAG: BBP7 family outer membrane beta-barrel protein [Planctomycetota bacterium]